jgi:hypothetical protein
MVSQIVSRTTEFKNAGVEEQELLTQLISIRTHLSADFENQNEEMEKLSDDINKAERMVHAAFEQEEEKTDDGVVS